MTEERMALIELVEKQADGDLVREMLAFAAERIMEAEIETFRLWLAGEVYGVVVEQVSDPCAPDCKGCDDCDCDWVMVDSMWGFYGLDTRTNGMTDYVPEELHDMLHAAAVEYDV